MTTSAYRMVKVSEGTNSSRYKCTGCTRSIRVGKNIFVVVVPGDPNFH